MTPTRRNGLAALILLLLSTGARISEILRLDRSDWNPSSCG